MASLLKFFSIGGDTAASPPLDYGRATEDLRSYLRTSALPQLLLDRSAPELPPPGHKSHSNALAVRAEAYRDHFRDVFTIDKSLDRLVTNWVNNYVPSEPIEQDDMDPLSGEALTLPRVGQHVPTPKRPSDLRRMTSWIEDFPLMTAQRVLHLIFPEDTRDYSFRFADETHREPDFGIFSSYLWSTTLDMDGVLPHIRSELEGRQVLVAVQPPWVLSDADMDEFASARRFPRSKGKDCAFPADLQSKDRVWAKARHLWDACVSRNTHWFILTNYNSWVFGGFSLGWTTAWISGVYPEYFSSPTILECLVFWLASATQLPGGVTIPKVKECLDSLGTIVVPAGLTDVPPSVASSESHWAVTADDVASSAGVTSVSASTHVATPLEVSRLQSWLAEKQTEETSSVAASAAPQSEVETAIPANHKPYLSCTPIGTQPGQWVA
ncbi:hypothetical protein FISHEDRAFT_71192 [Fistulina hepatica ATCC 64428]|nr:hypothetical protein FISHEDRAFT_71192 [Fistulina hepatica ATCC 64428]